MVDAEQWRVKRIQIMRFKALVNTILDIDGSDTAVIIGANGSGKSSILQALGFIRYFADGQSSRFFSDRDWSPSDVRTNFASKSLPFAIAIALTNGTHDILWYFSWSSRSEKNLFESISVKKEDDYRDVIKFNDETISFGKWKNKISGIAPEGSILSFLDVSRHPNEEDRYLLQSVRRWAEGVVSLELLSPASMRRMTRGSAKDIGIRGELLGGFLASMTSDQKERVVKRLERFYPALSAFETRTKRAGWIDLKIGEAFGSNLIKVGASQVSDGFLRLVALACVPEFCRTSSLVLLDEAENGIDPLILPDFVEMITRESGVQIVLTTHSPILVNRFPAECIHFLARSPDGPTMIARMTDMDEVSEELEFRGPGEIWAHSSLQRITDLVRRHGSKADESMTTSAGHE